jgi:predicted nucleic acid-binding Zn ribbon protein
VPEEADWQRRARLAAAALADAKADARAKGQHPASRGGARPARGARGGSPAAGGSAAQGESTEADGAPAGQGQAAVPGQQAGPAGTGRAAAPGPRRARRGGRTRREDPQPLSSALDGLLGDQGWRTAAAVGSVFGRWDQLVGADVAAHTRPERFSDGELLVVADSAAWATQVRLLTSTLLRRLNEELGHGTVARVVVRGPAPPRRMGPLRVRGTREYNDDYG